MTAPSPQTTPTLQQCIEEFRAQALREIEGLQSQIDSKELRRAEIFSSVCLEDASKVIEDSIRGSLAEKRRRISAEAARAVHLSVHGDMVSFSDNASGEKTPQARSLSRLQLLPYDVDPLTILSMLWGEKEIKEFAKNAALAAGAKPAPVGLRADEALGLYAELGAEIMELEEARKSAVATLKGFSSITLPELAKTRNVPVFSTMTPSPEPKVTVTGADGVRREQQAAPKDAIAQYYAYKEIEGNN